VLARLLRRFEVDGSEERKRIKIAAARVAAMMEHGQRPPPASTSRAIVAGGGVNGFTANAAKMWSVQGRTRWTWTGKSAAKATMRARTGLSSKQPQC
jgi:hypothetical protein